MADGRGTEWCSALGLGNPAAAKVVKDYLADVRREQLRARVVPCQAEPVFIADLQVISGFIQSRLLSGNLDAVQILVLARDQAFFKSLFFAGDRAADLLLIKTAEILRFPDDSGFLFNHCWTKTLRSGDTNVFAFKRETNKLVCLVWGIEQYLKICVVLGIRVSPGFLFRSVSKNGSVSTSSLDSSAAQARLATYVGQLHGKLSAGHA